MLCDAAALDLAVPSVEAAQALCRKQKSNGAAALARLLDTLEPGGAQGQVQVGYTITLQLLALYQRTPEGWTIDMERIDEMLRLITQVPRPVVLYLAADHFDSVGPLTQELLQEPRNLMQLADGKALELGYFGYRIVPYTLLTDASIPVNRYRYAALRAVAQRVQALPQAAQERIVAYTLAGELHRRHAAAVGLAVGSAAGHFGTGGVCRWPAHRPGRAQSQPAGRVPRGGPHRQPQRRLSP